MDFVKDYPLQCFLHDATVAKTITSVVAVAEKQRISPDEAAADMPQFEQYWHHQAQKLEDVCRQAQTFPNLFFTIAPAEWRFPLHGGMFDKADQDDLSQCQAWLTMHMRNCIGAILDEVLWKNKAQAADLGIAEIEHYTYRFEFQGRGTLHVHAVAWVKFNPGVSIEELSGRSGVGVQTSPLVRLLEEVFDCGAVDVQCGHSEHNSSDLEDRDEGSSESEESSMDVDQEGSSDSESGAEEEPETSCSPDCSESSEDSFIR